MRKVRAGDSLGTATGKAFSKWLANGVAFLNDARMLAPVVAAQLDATAALDGRAGSMRI
jgi:hypothetical protein